MQDGLLVDYLNRHEHLAPFRALPARELSVLRLGRLCGFDEAHARTVARLAFGLFDSARLAGLHRLGDDDRELLGYAALLHDCGMFLSHTNHQAHSYYFIHNADLLGFDQDELDVIATTALYHRKPAPRPSHPEFAALTKGQQARVRVLAALLRLAESLDRSHAGLVERVALRPAERKTVVLEIDGGLDCTLEVWGVQSQDKAFRKVFGRDLIVERVSERKAPIQAPERLLG
ncbi:MAG: HD domain-containing protein [Planctomycetota bacterium]|nr:HD domain-containing protein [Planctomycetota bacterium]